jgi:hypothetical protein
MNISIKICCQVASRLISLDTANEHDGLSWFFSENPVDVKFMVRVGEKYLVDNLGHDTGMEKNSNQNKDARK